MIDPVKTFEAYEYLPTPLIIFSSEKVIYTNRKALELLGIPKSINKATLNVFDYILPEYHKQILERNKKVLKGLKLLPFGVKVKTKKGKIIDIETKSNNIKINGEKYILTVFYEVTDKIELNSKLNESKEILDLIGRSNIDIVFKFNYYPKEEYTYVSNSFFKILGYKPEDLYKDRNLIKNITHPEDRKEVPSTKNAYLNYIQKNKKTTCRYYAKNKSIVWLETMFNIIKDKKGRVVSIVGLSRDVTKEKETETSLNVTKEQLSLIANNAHDIIYFYTYQPKPKYLFISNSVEKVLGYKPSEFYKDPFFINKRTIGKSNPFKENEID